MDTQNPQLRFLLRFEAHCELGPVHSAKLLGVPYITYSQWRNGKRKLKLAYRQHMDVLMLLDRPVLRNYIDEVVHDGL